MKVLITGATGFVGKVVTKELLKAGHEVVVLTRNIPRAVISLGSKCEYHQWADVLDLPPAEAFTGVEGIIHLMGESIGDKRWTTEQKKKIYNSRIDSSTSLLKRIQGLKLKLKVLVSTSAVGIYGNRSNEEITEESPLGNDYLSHVCKDWEKSALSYPDLFERICILRVGVVLGHKGGALKKMLPIFKLGLGGPLGSGKQYMSWIHVDDLAQMYLRALTDDKALGILNATAPFPASNKEFTQVLSKVLRRPAVFPAPAIALKTILGEMSCIVLEGQRVVPAKFKELNFIFKYPTLEKALKETAY